MKSEKGITLLSITVYLILLVVALTLLAMLRSFFFDNVSLSTNGALYASEFNKLNAFIVQDAKRNYNVGIVSNRGTTPGSEHSGANEKTPVAAWKFGNGNIYIYYGNSDKGANFPDQYKYLDKGVFKYTNNKRQGGQATIKIAGGVTDLSVARKVRTVNGVKKGILEVGVEIANGEAFTNMANPIRYTLKYW